MRGFFQSAQIRLADRVGFLSRGLFFSICSCVFVFLRNVVLLNFSSCYSVVSCRVGVWSSAFLLRTDCAVPEESGRMVRTLAKAVMGHLRGHLPDRKSLAKNMLHHVFAFLGIASIFSSVSANRQRRRHDFTRPQVAHHPMAPRLLPPGWNVPPHSRQRRSVSYNRTHQNE